MRDVLRCAVLTLAVLLALPARGLSAPTGTADHPPGQGIYRDGVLASGEPLRATVQQGVQLSGAQAACASCHRRSGLGGSEGSNTVRPIAGRLLFQTASSEPLAVPPGTDRGERARAAARPAYDKVTLARVLREGKDPAGRRLDPLMPRYALGDTDIDQLHAYLSALSAEPAPGVTAAEIHFATIVTPGVRPEKRQAMLDVLHTFVSDKNAGTRQEARRRQVRSERMYLAHRTWVLHVWELRGEPESWAAQLAAHYRRQPVFAVLGGMGSGSWAPVHAFCEAHELPCVFPDVDYPVVDAGAYYPLYFSRGITLEAQVLARHLRESGGGGAHGRVVQVYRDTAWGREPAQALRTELQDGNGPPVVDHPLPAGEPLAEGWLSELLERQAPGVLVLWLDAADLERLHLAGTPPAGLHEVYLSASLAELNRPRWPDHWLEKVRMVSTFELQDNRTARLARMTAWLRARKVPLADERAQANAFFAISVAGDAIAHLGENFSRDYFIERIEQMTENALSPSVYPRLSLGPGQRFAARGGHVLRFPADAAGRPWPVSRWLVP